MSAPIQLLDETVPIDRLRPHPRNYKVHPPDQVAHIAASLDEFGFYRDVVVADDYTILAGHGVVDAARSIYADGRTIRGETYEIASDEGTEERSVVYSDEVPVRRLVGCAPDSPEALKVLANDNELGRFAERHDRVLTELLREIQTQSPTGLVGTGYDEMALANLLLITRPASEIRNADAASEWVGMPGYTPAGDTWKIVLNFKSERDRQRFLDEFADVAAAITFSKFTPLAISGWWPKPDEIRNDSALRWEQNGETAEVDG